MCCVINAVNKFVNCASISAFVSDPVFRVVLYIPECSLPIAAASFSQSVFSFHRDQLCVNKCSGYKA